MEKYTFMRTIIESAVKKGIQYISDNPKRGVRNLLDLGEYFASGRFQKTFFDISHEILNNEDSFYYDRIEDLVHRTSHEAIAGFGINLGYNSFTYGANTIREYEKDSEYKIPWTIVFDFREMSQDHLTSEEIEKVIKGGKTFGIYCYIFLINSSEQLLDFYEVIKDNDDCAILLIVHPRLITEQTVERLSRLTNICLFVVVNGTDRKALKESTDLLEKDQCLYGGGYFYDDESDLNMVEGGEFSHILRSIHANFVMMIQKPNCNEKTARKSRDLIYKSRFKTHSPAFFVDFYGDIQRVGSIISEEPKRNYFLGIDSTGQISLSCLENKTKYTIRDSDIKEVFKASV